MRVERLAEDRLRISALARPVLTHVFPKHWSFLLGEIALYSFIVLVAPVTYLAFFYEPSLAETTYEGSYEPLRGVVISLPTSRRCASAGTCALAALRQVHHWARWSSWPRSPRTSCGTSSPVRSAGRARSTG